MPQLSVKLLALAVAACIANVATAVVVIPGSPADPVADTFGALPVTEFGGDGIPNDAVAISTSVDGGNTITLGLAATPRFVGSVGNDGMGRFIAQAGDGDPGLAKWNFSFYTNVDGGGSLADYRFELGYDLDSAIGNGLSTHGTIDFNASVGAANLATTTTVEGSQNLGFGYLTTGIPGVVTAPVPATTFDTDDLGEYTFQLRVYDSLVGGSLLDQVSISVSAVPEPTAALFGSLLAGGLGMTIARRRRSQSDEN